MYFSTEQFPTQTAVERHLETFVLKLNTDNPTLAVQEPTFDALLDRFIEEERLLEIKKVRPGESCDNVGELSFSTASSYLSVIKRVRAKWGTTRITRLKPMNVQEWLRNLEAAPKTKGHIKAVIHRLYEKAMLWEMVEWQRNPMEFVEIKGISKRRKRPVILTVEQFFLILPLIPQPYRMMALLAQCSGLRVEEVLAIEKPDIHFEKLSMQIVRAVVHGRVKLVKTEYSEDELPLDPDSPPSYSTSFAKPNGRPSQAGRRGRWDHRVGPALCQSHDGTAFPRFANRTGLHSSRRLLSRGLPELWGGCR